METKEFSIGVILSISHSILLCEVGGLYEILNHMTNDMLYTHQLPRAANSCRPFLLKKLSWLNDSFIDECLKGVVKGKPETIEASLAKLSKEYGEFHSIMPIDEKEWEHINPIIEAIQMVGEDKVMTINV